MRSGRMDDEDLPGGHTAFTAGYLSGWEACKRAAVKEAEDHEMVERFGKRMQAEGEFGACVYRKPLPRTLGELEPTP